MIRCLLHKSKLTSFVQWCALNDIEARPPRGEYQVLQVRLKDGQWACVYDRAVAPEHYTVDRRIESVVRQFIRSTRQPIEEQTR
jgi:hypothetical protein